MPEDVRSCPLCRSDRSQSFDRRVFHGQAVQNRICRACGLVYQSPRLTDEERETFYAQEYRLLYGGSAEPTARDLTIQRARAEALLAFSRPFVQAISSHLDIGCSVGILLQRFAEAYSCHSTGVEPGEAHRRYAQQQGIEVYASLEALMNKTSGKTFDFVSMAHVLEHLPLPVDYLECLRTSVLSPNGWLLLEVPNLYAHDCFEIAHLVSFSVHTLRETLYQAGYKIVRLQQHGHPRSRLVPYYITVLARPCSSLTDRPIRPERLVRLKRAFGLWRRRILTRCFPKQAWQEIG